jgi:hypothetical protein
MHIYVRTSVQVVRPSSLRTLDKVRFVVRFTVFLQPTPRIIITGNIFPFALDPRSAVYLDSPLSSRVTARCAFSGTYCTSSSGQENMAVSFSLYMQSAVIEVSVMHACMSISAFLVHLRLRSFHLRSFPYSDPLDYSVGPPSEVDDVGSAD